MIHIELSQEKVFRGQTFEGAIHFSSFSPYTAEEVITYILMKERDPYSDHRFIKKVLCKGENVGIDSEGEYIPFEYTVPEDAPYSILQSPVGIEWGVYVSIKKSKFSSEKIWHKFVVLPHVLKSESPPPLDKVPIPLGEGFPSMTGDFVRLWRYFARSKAFSIHTDEKEYSPGDTVSGALHIAKQFNNATLRIYLVLLKGVVASKKGTEEKEFLVGAEEERLVLHTKETFQPGSQYPFSFPLSPLTYPDFESKNRGIHWKLRAILRNPFRTAKVAECDLKVRPLVF